MNNPGEIETRCDELELFVLPDSQRHTEPELSADRRRTLRQHALVEAGVHPLRGTRVHADQRRRCGNCRWRELLQYHRRSYPKCTHPGTRSADDYEQFGPPNVTHGAASDVRAWWPGCADHEFGDTGLSLDAARWVPEVSA